MNTTLRSSWLIAFLVFQQAQGCQVMAIDVKPSATNICWFANPDAGRQVCFRSPLFNYEFIHSWFWGNHNNKASQSNEDPLSLCSFFKGWLSVWKKGSTCRWQVQRSSRLISHQRINCFMPQLVAVMINYFTTVYPSTLTPDRASLCHSRSSRVHHLMSNKNQLQFALSASGKTQNLRPLAMAEQILMFYDINLDFVRVAGVKTGGDWSSWLTRHPWQKKE